MLEKPIGSRTVSNLVPADAPAFFSADEFEIERVILNLVLNARDTKPDKGTITIESRLAVLGDGDVPHDRKAGPFVQLSVSDDGTGMSPETRERIFEACFTTK